MKTRRKIDITFTNAYKHVVQLTLFLQMCKNTSYNWHYVCKCVRTHRKISIMFCQCVKTRCTNYIIVVNVSTHVIKLTLLLPMCQNTSYNLHYVCQCIKTRLSICIKLSFWNNFCEYPWGGLQNASNAAPEATPMSTAEALTASN